MLCMFSQLQRYYNSCFLDFSVIPSLYFSMTRPSTLKNERKSRLARNVSASRKTVNNVTKKTRQLQNTLISDTDSAIDNEHFRYKQRPFTGPSCQKLSTFAEQLNTSIDNDTDDYYQVIHNSFLVELMKQTICISCKSIWNGDMTVAKREGTVFTVLLRVKSNN